MKRKKVIRLLFLLILSLAICFGISKPYITAFAKSKIKDELKSKDIETYGLEISLFPFSIRADSASYYNQKEETNLFLKNLVVSHIHILPFLKNKEIKIDRVSLAYINFHKSKQKGDSIKVNNKSFSSSVKYISINSFLIKDGDSKIIHDKEKSIVSSSYGNRVKIKDLEFEPKELMKAKFGQLSLTFDSIIYTGKKVRIKSKHIGFENSKAKILSFELEDQLKSSYPFQKTKYDLKVEDIELLYDVKQIIQSRYLKIKLLNAEKFTLKSSLDKRKPRNKEYKSSLTEVLQGIPINFCLDSIEFANGTVYYKEFVKQSPFVSEVSFHNILLSSSNLTNTATAIRQSKWFSSQVSANFLNQAPLNCSIKFDLSSQASSHFVKGSLHQLPFKKLNPILAPLVSINFKSGVSEKVLFHFQGNKTKSTGEVKFYYQDLKIQFQGKKQSKSKQVLRSIAGGLANTLLIRTENPLGNTFKVGTIEYKRDPYRSVFNFWWKSVFSGMTETVLKVNPQKLN